MKKTSTPTTPQAEHGTARRVAQEISTPLPAHAEQGNTWPLPMSLGREFVTVPTQKPRPVKKGRGKPAAADAEDAQALLPQGDKLAGGRAEEVHTEVMPVTDAAADATADAARTSGPATEGLLALNKASETPPGLAPVAALDSTWAGTVASSSQHFSGFWAWAASAWLVVKSGQSQSDPTPSTPAVAPAENGSVSGLITLGPLVKGNNLKVQVYDAQGRLIGSQMANADGSYTVTLTQKPATGVIRVVAVGVSDGQADFVGEDARLTEFVGTVSAVSVLTSGAQPSAVVNITHITDVLARQFVAAQPQANAAQDGVNVAATAEQVLAASAAFAKALGVGNGSVALERLVPKATVAVGADGASAATPTQTPDLYGQLLKTVFEQIKAAAGPQATPDAQAQAANEVLQALANTVKVTWPATAEAATASISQGAAANTTPEMADTLLAAKLAHYTTTAAATGSPATAPAPTQADYALAGYANVTTPAQAQAINAQALAQAQAQDASQTPAQTAPTLVQAVAEAVNHSNAAPTAVTLSTALTHNTLAENTPTTARIKVADIAVTDDALGTHNCTLSGTDASHFEIEGQTLYLKAGTALDFETQASYTVTVQAQDSTVVGSTPVSASYTLTVSDVNEVQPDTTAPAFSAGTTQTVAFAENTATTTVVATATATDAVGVTAYSLDGGADDGLFSLDAQTGALKFKVSPDFEAPGSAAGSNAYTVKVRASDQAGNSAVQTLTINVTDVDDTAPTFSAGTTQTVAFAENTATTTVVATATATDAVGVTAYSLDGGADDELFELNSTTGALKFKVSPDFEAPGSAAGSNAYTVKVRASDQAGNSAVQTLTINVTDVDDTAPAFSAGTTQTVAFAENTATTTVVATATATDAVGVTAYSLDGGADDELFELNSTTGALKFKVSPDIEAPGSAAGSNVYTVKVRASDQAGNSAVQTLTINVTDVDDTAPTFSAGTTQTVAFAENTATTTVVATATATDAVGVTAYSLDGGADDGLFSLDTQTGALTFKTSPDFEAPGSAAGSNAYTVKVKASDAAGNSAVQTVTVNVTDVNEVPTDVNEAPTAVGQMSDLSASTGRAIAPIYLSDFFADADADVLSYRISAGSLPVGLTLTEGVIKGTPTEATPGPVALTITADDGQGGTTTQQLNVSVAESGFFTVQETGASANRVDMVFVGDGYQAADIATTYRNHVNSLVNYLFDGSVLTQPFGRYQSFFNIYAVKVVSNQTGIDDSSKGIAVETALGGYVHPSLERLLVVDSGLANAATSTALAGTDITPDMKFATLNVSQYGGSGGEWAVYSGNGAGSLEVAVHEVAHSFTGVGDEYDNGGSTVHAATETPAVNTTIDPTGQHDWADWLGTYQRGIGLIGAYEGADYSPKGAYRPSLNSKMKSLGQAFDVVTREKFVLDFYAKVNPLDSYSSTALTQATSLSVKTIDPSIIRLLWRVDGMALNTRSGVLDLSTVLTDNNLHTVTLEAWDDTDWVRPAYREQLKQTVSWTVRLPEASLVTPAPNGARLTGTDGDDVLMGGQGNNTIDGGAGLDAVSYAHFSEAVTVSLAHSQDTLRNIENLVGGNAGDTLTGDDMANNLQGGLGNDALQGAAGSDVLDGGAGDDSLQGGLANDALFGMAGQDQLSGDEGNDLLEGGDGNDTLAGGAGDDVLAGQAGNDTVNGGDGHDTLEGGEGNNALDGGAGDDTLSAQAGAAGAGANTFVGGAGNDTVSYAWASSAVAVSLAVASAQSTGVSTDTLDGIENLQGGAGNDTLAGNTGNNELVGGAGDDVLLAGGGSDILVGGAGVDTVSFKGVGTGVTLSLASVAAQTTGAVSLQVLQVENLIGSDGADVLTGDANNNVIEGGADRDTLNGGAGSDTFVMTGDFAQVITVKPKDVSTVKLQTMVLPTQDLLLEGTYNLTFDTPGYQGGYFWATNSTFAKVTLTGMSADGTLEGLAAALRADSDYASVSSKLTIAAGTDANAGKLVVSFNTTGSVSATAKMSIDTLSADTLTDFASGTDQIQLDGAAFVGLSTDAQQHLLASQLELGVAASSAQSRILYDSATGALRYDRDGNGTAYAAQVFALLANKPATVSAADFSVVGQVTPELVEPPTTDTAVPSWITASAYQAETPAAATLANPGSPAQGMGSIISNDVGKDGKPAYASMSSWLGMTDNTNTQRKTGASMTAPLGLTYAFQNPGALYKDTSGAEHTTQAGMAYTDAEKAFVRSVFAQFASVSNVLFTENQSQDYLGADLRLFKGTGAEYGVPESVMGFATQPTHPDAKTVDSYGNLFLVTDAQAYPAANKAFTTAYGAEKSTVTHELGHAMGLDHPFKSDTNTLHWFGDTTGQDTNRLGTLTGGSYDNPQTDAPQETIMTYLSPFGGVIPSLVGSGGSAPTATERYSPIDLGLYDIAALQHLYGVNMGHKTGDDTYSFDSNTPVFTTIWDAKGNDTLKQVGELGAVIDLRGGEHMSRMGLFTSFSASFSKAGLESAFTISGFKPTIKAVYGAYTDAANVEQHVGLMRLSGDTYTYYDDPSMPAGFDVKLIADLDYGAAINAQLPANALHRNFGTLKNVGVPDESMAYNIGIAFGVVIENAIGGDGNDVIWGNAAANTITTGAGNDVVKYDMAAHIHGDTLLDFSATDQLDLKALGLSAATVQWDAGSQKLSHTATDPTQSWSLKIMGTFHTSQVLFA